MRPPRVLPVGFTTFLCVPPSAGPFLECRVGLIDADGCLSPLSSTGPVHIVVRSQSDGRSATSTEG